MKKLLAVLTSISILGPSSLTMMAISAKTHTSPQKIEHKIDSFKNIVKIVNWNQRHKDSINSDYMNRLLDGMPRDFYKTAVNQEQWNKGNVLVWSTVPRNDMQVIKSYENTYTNNTSSVQISRTQSRTETVTGTHQFTMNLTEKITNGIGNKITGKISLPLGGIEDTISFEFGSEKGTEKTWTDTTTTSVEETAPSQEIKQNPYTILHVKYLIKQGTLDYKGIAQFKITDLLNKLIRIPIFYFGAGDIPEEINWETYSMNEILKILKEEGYGNQLISKKENEYAIVSVDNINDPRLVFLNLPIEWSSQASGISLEYYEEPIEKSSNK